MKIYHKVKPSAIFVMDSHQELYIYFIQKKQQCFKSFLAFYTLTEVLPNTLI